MDDIIKRYIKTEPLEEIRKPDLKKVGSAVKSHLGKARNIAIRKAEKMRGVGAELRVKGKPKETVRNVGTYSKLRLSAVADARRAKQIEKLKGKQERLQHKRDVSKQKRTDSFAGLVSNIVRNKSR